MFQSLTTIQQSLYAALEHCAELDMKIQHVCQMSFAAIVVTICISGLIKIFKNAN